jgi:ATP-dependent DNA helicase UvrD/PcrA
LTLELNQAQRAAVEHQAGPLLVLAGAGSGKTRVLTARIADLIRSRGVRPERIFAVTFTNKAAQEMRSRVEALLGADPRGLWIGTFHSLSARLLRREAALLGFTPSFTIYDEDDQAALIKRLMEQRKISPKAYPPKAIQAIISGAKNRMQEPEEFATTVSDPLGRVTAEIFAALGPALQASNAMDFDDLLVFPLRLFGRFPERLAHWRGRFDHLLVDEFQDTNTAQYLLVRQLAEAHGRITVVGDDDQAIYGWRGADVRNMQYFRRDFASSTVVRLEENYRSTQVILDAANGVIAENTERLGKTLFTQRQGGEPITVLSCADERDEAEWLARELADRVVKGDVAHREVALLYRTNAQSRPLEEALRFRGIPYQLIGAVSFYERREVKDLLAYLRLLVNPADNEAFLRAVNVPRRGVGDTSLSALIALAGRSGRSLLDLARAADDAPELRGAVREGLKGFAGLVDALRTEVGKADPARALERIIQAIGYEKYLADEGPEGVERAENVAELVAGAAEWAEVQDAGAGSREPGAEEAPAISRFLQQAALLTSTDKRGGDPKGVTLMTLHMAKGLEWRIVVLAGLEDGLFPLARAAGEPGGLEEERRLCYVGLTRARDKLYLSWARTRYRNGRMDLSEPSRFLESVPPECVEERETSPKWGDRWRGSRRRAPRWSPLPDLPMEDETVADQDAPRYQKGERVRHRRFGAGTIAQVTGSGPDLKVTVQFDDGEVGIKQLLAAYAALERECESA